VRYLTYPTTLAWFLCVLSINSYNDMSGQNLLFIGIAKIQSWLVFWSLGLGTLVLLVRSWSWKTGPCESGSVRRRGLKSVIDHLCSRYCADTDVKWIKTKHSLWVEKSLLIYEHKFITTHYRGSDTPEQRSDLLSTTISELHCDPNLTTTWLIKHVIHILLPVIARMLNTAF